MTIKNAIVLLGTSAFVACAYAADLSVPDSWTYDNPYKLTADAECDALKLAEGAVLDLNGHNLVVKAGSDDKSAIVTNSVAGVTARISMSPADNNGWGQQFQGNLKFGGNLELTVCGIVNKGRSWGRRGFRQMSP